MRIGINERENRQTKEKMDNDVWVFIFLKIYKVGKLIARLIKTTEEEHNIRNEMGNITRELTDSKKILKECYEQLYINKSDNSD